VGDACLELHSNKTNKRVLLQELKRTWELGAPRASFLKTLSENLENERDILNLHSAAMHTEHSIARLTPFQTVGELTELLRVGQTPVDFDLPDAPRWNPDETERRRQLLDEFADQIRDLGLPAEDPWAGVGLTAILPTDVERLVTRIGELSPGPDAEPCRRSPGAVLA
jgi:hypothetical protein